MPKQKTKKSVAKRFKVTKRGEILHRSQHLRHLRSKKGKKRIRRLKQLKKIEGTYKKKILKMLGKK
ncbi:MAG: bL35 family ribosomal protein [Microgenomates group bacterium]|nr:bL35 family ribosomal protein [Microgenomates group bacterium]